jgi:hypothetical protein
MGFIASEKLMGMHDNGVLHEEVVSVIEEERCMSYGSLLARYA